MTAISKVLSTVSTKIIVMCHIQPFFLQFPAPGISASKHSWGMPDRTCMLFSETSLHFTNGMAVLVTISDNDFVEFRVGWGKMLNSAYVMCAGGFPRSFRSIKVPPLYSMIKQIEERCAFEVDNATQVPIEAFQDIFWLADIKKLCLTLVVRDCNNVQIWGTPFGLTHHTDGRSKRKNILLESLNNNNKSTLTLSLFLDLSCFPCFSLSMESIHSVVCSTHNKDCSSPHPPHPTGSWSPDMRGGLPSPLWCAFLDKKCEYDK